MVQGAYLGFPSNSLINITGQGAGLKAKRYWLADILFGADTGKTQNSSPLGGRAAYSRDFGHVISLTGEGGFHPFLGAYAKALVEYVLIF